MLSAQNISCQRGRQLLWKDLSFQTQPGAITFIRGANGQGKSSLLRMMAGLASPYEGEILWRGQNLKQNSQEFRQSIRYLGHITPLKGDLDALSNIRFLMQVHGLYYEEEAIISTLQDWGLSLKTVRLPTKFLSQGQKQRVSLAQLDLAQSCLWILDEPFNGLDSTGSDILMNAFSRHLAKHGAIVLTSHLHSSIQQADTILQGFSEEIIELKGVN